MTDALSPARIMSPLATGQKAPRVAVVCDFLEEGWPSMDLVGDMLVSGLAARQHASGISAEQLRPAMRRRLPKAGGWPAATADRLINRMVDYPRYLRARRAEFDLFHIVDHSYSQLVHDLPAERTVITCHDLDTFRCLIEPARERRGWAFRAVARRVLEGMRKAAVVTCDTAVIRDELLAYGLVDAARLRVVHNGVHPSCTPEPDAESDAAAARLLGPGARGALDILHVGSTIPRKAIDVLLRIVAAVRAEMGPGVRLVRVGGPLTADQRALAAHLGVEDAVVSLPFLSRPVLAAVYRRAAVVLLPSRAEGFGLPVIEALACGAPVVASDLPVLRETGGAAVLYCPRGDVSRWRDVTVELLRGHVARGGPDARTRQAGIQHASGFTWASYTRQVEAIYAGLLVC